VNPVAALIGSVKALAGREGWTDHFDLTRKGLQQSFIALLLTIPAFYLIAHAVQVERAKMLEEGVSGVPLAPFAIILLLYLLTFSAVAYIFAMIFDKQDRFRPWVVSRHWSIFWLVLIVAGLFGLYLIGVIPFAIVNYIQNVRKLSLRLRREKSLIFPKDLRFRVNKIIMDISHSH